MKNKIYKLIHVFEDEWLYKKQIVENRLKHILGVTKYKIGARKCVIKEITPQLKNKFLEKYHIQGEDRSSIKLGAFYKNHLVAVMTFGKARFNKNYKWELIRFCTVGSFTIIGVANKLLNFFINKFNSDKNDIISYADRRWSVGGLYKVLGFELLRTSKPNYWYLIDKGRKHRFNFRKSKLKNMQFYHIGLTEWEIMQLNSIDRIWDCGNYCFEYKAL